MSIATLTKKQKKQFRKQLMQKKQALLAKHAPGSQATRGARFGGGGYSGAGDTSGGGFRTLSDAKSKLPTYTPAVSAAGRRATPVIKTTTPPKPAAKRQPRILAQASGPAQTRAVLSGAAMETTTGPGVLQRAAARLEHLGARLAALRHWRPRKPQALRMPRLPRIPWHRFSADATAPGFGTLATIVWPLRLCGLVAIGGAVKLALEAHSRGASFVATVLVLGMGVAVAVMILALAEIARALRHLMHATA